MSDKPYFLNMRHNWEFPIHKKLIWRIFGKRVSGITETEEGKILVVGYTLANITYVNYVGPV